MDAQKALTALIAKRSVSAWTVAAVTPWLAPVTALLASSGQTAVNLVLKIIMGRIVSNGVPVAQDNVTLWLEGASVPLAKWEPGVSKDVPRQGMGQIVS